MDGMTTTSILGTQKMAAFAAVRNRDAARTFYRDTLGLTLLGEDRFALVFDANGTTLRLSPMPDWTPPQFTVLGWEVDDIVTVVKSLETNFRKVNGITGATILGDGRAALILDIGGLVEMSHAA